MLQQLFQLLLPTFPCKVCHCVTIATITNSADRALLMAPDSLYAQDVANSSRILSSYGASTSAPSAQQDVYYRNPCGDVTSVMSAAHIVCSGMSGAEGYHYHTPQDLEETLLQAHNAYRSGEYQRALSLCQPVSASQQAPR
jgi:hypothetical protein